jgi:hypothetical protein
LHSKIYSISSTTINSPVSKTPLYKLYTLDLLCLSNSSLSAVQPPPPLSL